MLINVSIFREIMPRRLKITLALLNLVNRKGPSNQGEKTLFSKFPEPIVREFSGKERGTLGGMQAPRFPWCSCVHTHVHTHTERVNVVLCI